MPNSKDLICVLYIPLSAGHRVILLLMHRFMYASVINIV